MSIIQKLSNSHLSPWQLAGIAIVSMVVGLLGGGIAEIVVGHRDAAIGVVVFGATLVTLFAVAEVDSVMKDDPLLRSFRLVAIIVIAWAAVGVALPWLLGFPVGVIMGLYVIRRAWLTGRDNS
jgi:hypothetical protein